MHTILPYAFFTVRRKMTALLSQSKEDKEMSEVNESSVFGAILQPENFSEFFDLMNVMRINGGDQIVAVDLMPGGLTNTNFVVTLADGKRAAVRVAGYGTSAYIDRVAEKHNLSLIGNMGIAPEIYFFNTITGGLISEFIPYATMHPDDFIHNNDVLQEAAKAISACHNSGVEFKGRFDPISKIMEYLEIMKQHNFNEKYAGMDEALSKLDRIKAAYEKNPPHLVPCHNDTLAENFMYDGTEMRIIDWEYSGMNDGFYDIACMIVENPLNEEKEAILLKAYVGGEPSELQLARTLINKFLVTTHWSLWSLVQICSGKDYDFYWEYGRYRSDFFNGFMADPNFNRYIELLGEK